MLFFISLLIYLLAAIPVTLLLFPSFRLSRWAISFFLTAFAGNVFIAEILELIQALDLAWLFLLLQAILCAGLVFLSLHGKALNLQSIKKQFSESWKQIHWIDYLLLAVMLLITASVLLIGLGTPPNNIDSLHSHLPRIYYWLQHGSFASWAASSMAQLSYPINAHIQGLWLFLLSGNENTFFLVQWFSMIVTMGVVYELARLLGFTLRQSLAAALVMLSFPVVLLQAYSFQGDLTVTALIMICILLIFLYLQEKRSLLLAAAMLPLALALGTKQTAFFFLPAAGIFMLYWMFTGQIKKQHIPWLGIFLLFFMVFSAQKYIQNLAEQGSVFGQNIISEAAADPDYHVLEKAKYNIPRYLFQFISFEGLLPRIANPLQNFKARVFRNLTSAINLNLEETRYLQPGFDPSEAFHYQAPLILGEDSAWYGPLSFLLLPAALIAAAFRKEPVIRQYFVFALVFMVSYCMILLWQRPGWDPYQGRYFFLGFAPILPLLAGLIPTQKFQGRGIPLILAAVVLILGGSTILFNHTKPVLTQNLGYQWMNQYVQRLPAGNRLEILWKGIAGTTVNGMIDSGIGRTSIFQSRYYEQMYFNNTGSIASVELVNAYIPDDAALYLKVRHNPMEYALFGKNKSRLLFPIEDWTVIPQGACLLIDKQDPMISELAGFVLLASNDQFAIYQRD